MNKLPVLICGAGPASLLLAQSLRLSNIPFHIFERDASLSFRGQGYRLRLSSEGLDAIEDVLSPSHFQHFYDRCGKTGGAGFGGYDARTAKLLESDPGGEKLGSRDGKIVGIARGEMRNVFFEGLESQVEFGKHVKGYELVHEGGSQQSTGVRAIFADGSKSVVGSLIVGGEGIKSAVAKQVSNGKLKVYDTGRRGIHGQAPTTAFKGLGEGVFRVQDPQTDVGIITNVRPNDMDDPNVEFGWTMSGPPEIVRAPNEDYTIVGKVAADIAKRLTSEWNEKFQPLFREMNENEAAFWKISCSTPSGVPLWENDPRVTVIGDAAHSMTPAGGIGCNTAVRDSALLGRLLREAGGWEESITGRYEEVMRVYGSEAVKTSYGLAHKSWGIEIVEGKTLTVN